MTFNCLYIQFAHVLYLQLWLPFDDHSDAEALTIEHTIFLCSVILCRNLMVMIALVVIHGARMLEEAFMIPVFSVS